MMQSLEIELSERVSKLYGVVSWIAAQLCNVYQHNIYDYKAFVGSDLNLFAFAFTCLTLINDGCLLCGEKASLN